MKKLLVITIAILGLLANTAFGALTVVNNTATGYYFANVSSPSTFDFDATGGNLLVVGVTSGTATDSTVTYGGVSMTKYITKLGANSGTTLSQIFYLKNPTTGSNTVSISFAGSGQYLASGAILINGFNNSVPDASSTATATNTNTININATTINNNSMVISNYMYGDNCTGVTNSANEIQRVLKAPANGCLAMSTAVVTSTATITNSATANKGTGGWSAATMIISEGTVPSPASTPPQMKVIWIESD